MAIHCYTMQDYILSREERETVIIMTESDDDCIIYSMSNPVKRKLHKFVSENPDHCSIEREDQYETKVIIPKSYVHLYAPRNTFKDQSKAGQTEA